ncbi:protein atonal hypothetical protein [Limosa lapponica baueri]|uniref:BHLH domain-containing protein n=1 Tax=Limosa lapponica baueri TaxID=1758121 RepID=A0A2I0URJ9_LIMLA|nr:protein atonal hypothetical protein [Limosa lapponica baueri]
MAGALNLWFGLFWEVRHHDRVFQQVPCYSYGQKLSKLAILRIACNYILSLARLADLDYSADHSNMSFSECVEQCTRTLQAEGRSKKRKTNATPFARQLSPGSVPHGNPLPSCEPRLELLLMISSSPVFLDMAYVPCLAGTQGFGFTAVPKLLTVLVPLLANVLMKYYQILAPKPTPHQFYVTAKPQFREV